MAEESSTTWQQLAALLCTILTTAFTSTLLSITLAFRAANARFRIRRNRARPTSLTDKRGNITFYRGTVFHERRFPTLHKFSYSVRYALFNLDSPPSCFSCSSAADYHMNATAARCVAGTSGPVYLLTVPPSVGYEQNPLSVYYCFSDYDETCLSACIAEVTNTPWGERVTFVFNPNGDAVAKPLHVSPFMDMSGAWKMKASVPEQKLTIKITVDHPEHGRYFVASLAALQVECSEKDSEKFFWLMPHKSAIGIYWQALLLWWKGVPFQQHPKYVDRQAYRACAIERDKEITSSRDQAHKQNVVTSSSSPCPQLSTVECPKRSFTWREANWPWT